MLPMRRLLEWVKESALRQLSSRIGVRAGPGGGAAAGPPPASITWVLTVPAIWTEGAKAFMRAAAEEAGLVGRGADGDRLVFALEPEAAAIASMPSLEGEALVAMTPGKEVVRGAEGRG